MNAQSFLELRTLATEKDSDKRRELLNRVTDLFFATPEDLRKSAEIVIFAELVSQLLATAKLDVREQYATRIADLPDAPRDIVLTLAKDHHSVADPVLRQSKALADQDIVAIASELGAEHRVAIAARANISVDVTDVLIRFDEPATLTQLVANISAAISDAGFEHLLAQGVADGNLADLLGQRPDLPIVIAQRLERDLEGGLKAKVKQMAQTLSQATAAPDLDTGTDWARRRIDIKVRVAELGEDEAARDVFVRGLIKGGNTKDVTLALAEMCGLPREQVAGVFAGYKSLPLALLARSIGLRKETYADLDHLRSGRQRTEAVQRKTAMDMYLSLDMELARRAMRFLKLRNGARTSGTSA